MAEKLAKSIDKRVLRQARNHFFNKKALADSQRRIKQLHAERKDYNKIILSKPGLKLFKFTIGPYQFLKDEWGTPWLHLFVVAKSQAEAIRLKKASDKKCVGTLRSRRHKWFVIAFNIGEVILA